MILIFAIPTFLEIFTNPLTTFGDAGTLAAFGFLLAYFLITIAAPAYLRKIGELRPGHIVLAVVALVCLMVPTIGSFYPLPPYPVRLFPYIFLGLDAHRGGLALRREPAEPRHPVGHRVRPRTGSRTARCGDRYPRLGGRGPAGHRRVTDSLPDAQGRASGRVGPGPIR